MSDAINRVLMAYRPLYLRGLLMDGQYRLPARSAQVSRGKRAPASPRAAVPASGLAAVMAVAAAARQSTQGVL